MELLQFGTKEPDVEYKDRPGVYALILNENGLFCATENSWGKYSLPGGGIDEGESDEVALRREIQEELIRDIELFQFVGEAKQFVRSKKNGDVNKHCKYFIVTLAPGEDGQGDVITRWVNLEQFKEKSYQEAHVWALETFLFPNLHKV